MLFSIIIPVKNASEFIKRAIDSIILQTFNDYEIIVIDDNSTDNTYEIVNGFSKINNNIKILNSSGYGVSAARNIGFSKASGQFVFFMDADDYYINNSLRIVENTINKYPEADIIFSGYNRVTEDGSLIKCFSYNYCYESGKEAMCNYLNKASFTHLGALCFKRSFLLHNGIVFQKGLDYAEDILFVSQALYRSKSVKSTDKIIYSWTLRMHSAMYSCTLNKFNSLKSMIYLRNSISSDIDETVNYSIGNQYSMLLLDTINTLVWMGIKLSIIRKTIIENVDWSLIPPFSHQSKKTRKPMFALMHFRILYLYHCRLHYVPYNFKKIGVKKYE